MIVPPGSAKSLGFRNQLSIDLPKCALRSATLTSGERRHRCCVRHSNVMNRPDSSNLLARARIQWPLTNQRRWSPRSKTAIVTKQGLHNPTRADGCDSRARTILSDAVQTSTQGWSLANAATLARVRFPDAGHDDGLSLRAAICRSRVGLINWCL